MHDLGACHACTYGLLVCPVTSNGTTEHPASPVKPIVRSFFPVPQVPSPRSPMFFLGMWSDIQRPMIGHSGERVEGPILGPSDLFPGHSMDPVGQSTSITVSCAEKKSKRLGISCWGLSFAITNPRTQLRLRKEKKS